MTKIKTHFDRDIQNQLQKVLKNAKYSIRVAMYTFTDKDLFTLLCEMAAKNIEVEILLDKKQYDDPKTSLGSSITRLENSGGSVFLYVPQSEGYPKMHNKFCIIDDKILVTGSYNWTYTGSNHSDENIVIIDDFDTAYKFGEKFNEIKKNSTLHHEDAELPIVFTVSKNVVKKDEVVEVSWKVPKAHTVTFDNDIVDNEGIISKVIDENRKFTLVASNGTFSSTKHVSVTIAEKPEILQFNTSENLIRRGQSVQISWEVKGASKIKIEPFGEVAAIGTREHLPQTDTIYKLITSDVWKEESIKELSVRVPDFIVPSFEHIQVITPQLSSIISVEIKKPIFSQNLTSQALNEILKKQEKLAVDRNHQLKNIKNNQNTFHKELSERIKEKSTQTRFNRIKEAIIDRTENVLTQLLAKLRESK